MYAQPQLTLPTPPTDPYLQGQGELESPVADGWMQKTYMAEIKHDVNVLNTSINLLIQSLGLDPMHTSHIEQGQGLQVVNPHNTVLLPHTGGTLLPNPLILHLMLTYPFLVLFCIVLGTSCESPPPPFSFSLPLLPHLRCHMKY
ncbi:hypothetical protein FIBSPDRAFT_962985 [Athelia psychrophila]|uniref:Uncharacterized protein n=1 Tax=Athelia psychrophila TaxID=1759441 RepID=A0A165ZH60_9AGAM|nr:hypothetical protein FIBSPDRAFT_962985 [Fibularhizoctonia sp. CBS 109695]